MKQNVRKSFLITLLLIMLFPSLVLAHSEYIIPGGENVGIEIQSEGIMIIGFYKVNGVSNNDLQVGDLIMEVNNVKVNRIDDLIKTINETIVDNKVEITYSRNNRVNTTILELEFIDGVYKTGLYVKDSITGIGTLTFIDPETLIYGALGHEIIESTTRNRVEVRTGIIFRSSVNGIQKSRNGNPGGKNARFFFNTEYGSIDKNTRYGIFGTFDSELPNREALRVGTADDIKLGRAHIYTVVDGEKIEKFEINITRVVKDNRIKNIHFTITDQRLLNRTGGIVQGMSGSPIIQNNMIIGAVTHVIVDNVRNGYGIFITTMLEEGER